eukprot:COSAG06_NODE_26882_length_605_cov_1.606719_2_plen_29_part_01
MIGWRLELVNILTLNAIVLSIFVAAAVAA